MIHEMAWIGFGSRPAKATAIAIDSASRPVVVYSVSENAYPYGSYPKLEIADGDGFTTIDLPLWQDDPAYVFWNFAMDVDDAGHIHIVAHISRGSPGQQLIYYTNASGDWTVEKVADFGPESESLDLLVDSLGRVQIMGATGGFNIQFSLIHAVLDGGNWTVNQVVEPTGTIVSGAFMGEMWDGEIAFVYYYGGKLMYGNGSGGTDYVLVELAGNASREEWPFATDSSGRGYIFGAGGWLWFQEEGGTWDAFKAANNNFSRQIELDDADTIHLSHVSAGVLEYTTSTRTEANTFEQILSGMNGRYARMAVTPGGKPYIVANTTGSLQLFEGSGGTGGPGNGSYWASTPEAATGIKWTSIGWIHDGQWPLIYHYKLGKWVYIFEGVSSIDSWLAYVYDDPGYFIWSSEYLAGEYLDLRDYTYKRFY